MVGRPRTPSILGIENPYTSASMMPTRWPICRSATARFTVTVDFPTPPFPLAMVRTRTGDSGVMKEERRVALTSPPRSLAISAWRSLGAISPRVTSTSRTPGMVRTRSRMLLTMVSRSGQALMVRRALTLTRPSPT